MFAARFLTLPWGMDRHILMKFWEMGYLSHSLMKAGSHSELASYQIYLPLTTHLFPVRLPSFFPKHIPNSLATHRKRHLAFEVSVVCHCSGTSTQAVKKVKKLRRIFLKREEMRTVKATALCARMSMQTSPEPANTRLGLGCSLPLGSWKPL